MTTTKKDELTIKVEKVVEDAKLPSKPEDDPTASGFDLYAHSIKKIYAHGGGNGERELKDDTLSVRMRYNEVSLQCNERALVGTGIKATIGKGYELQIRPRSGLSLKKGFTVVNTPGTVK